LRFLLNVVFAAYILYRRVRIVYRGLGRAFVVQKTGTLKEILFRGTWSCIRVYPTDVITTWGGSCSVDS
jgi:hypothetical protein